MFWFVQMEYNNNVQGRYEQSIRIHLFFNFLSNRKKKVCINPSYDIFMYIFSIIDMKDDTSVPISNSMLAMLFQISRNLK